MNESIQISLKELFYQEPIKKIIVPVIQRDYCMGSHMNTNDSLLAYILNKYKDSLKKDLILSAITVYESGEHIYIYDGQQRIFTLYCLLRFINNKLQENKLDSISEISKIEFEYRGAINKVFEEEKSGLVTYATRSVENLKDSFINKMKTHELKTFKEFILENIKFDKISVKGELSTAEQFFIDINSGIPIVPYEIFKCLLNDKADRCLKDKYKKNWFSNIDNEWLDIFYKFQNVKLSNEESKEELMEMRFIEFCCRMIYWEKCIYNAKLGKHALELKSFSNTNDTNDINDAIRFINVLDDKDFNRISKILDALNNLQFQVDSQNKDIAKLIGDSFYAGTQGNIKIGTLYFNITDEDNKKYIKQFLLNLCDDKLKEDRAKDLIMWAILNELTDKNIKLVKAVKNEWNNFVIYKQPIAYLTPNFVGTWNEIIYPIPQYYYSSYSEVYESLMGKEWNKDNKDNKDIEKNKLDNIMKIIKLQGAFKYQLKVIPEYKPECYDYMEVEGEKIFYPTKAKYKIVYKYKGCNYYRKKVNDGNSYGILRRGNYTILFNEKGIGYYIEEIDSYNFEKNGEYKIDKWDIRNNNVHAYVHGFVFNHDQSQFFVKLTANQKKLL